MENKTNEEGLFANERMLLDDQFISDIEAKEIVNGLASISKDVKESCVGIDKKQIRIIIDAYYQTQDYRIALANQIRSVAQGYDETSDQIPAYRWLLNDMINREAQINKMIEAYVKSEPVCRWSTKVIGIGPKFAAYLYSCIDLDKCTHASNWISYAGLNDNNNPWLGKEKAEKLVNKVFKDLGLNDKAKVDENVIVRVAIESHRSIATVKNGFNHHKNPAKGAKPSDKNALIAYLAKPPYNTELKKKAYLIGKSFVMQSRNENSLYASLYKEKKAMETYMNENREFADQAARQLQEKNYCKDKDTYKYLADGKLSPANIDARARRWATTKFFVHFFEACYVYKYKKLPPQIYPIAHMGHVDYIQPEVPYTELF